jgi:hypothetical protein
MFLRLNIQDQIYKTRDVLNLLNSMVEIQQVERMGTYPFALFETHKIIDAPLYSLIFFLNIESDNL